MVVRVGECACVWIGEEHPAVLVGDDLVARPGIEQGVRSGQEALGPLVPLVFGQEPAAPEVLPGERVPRRHDVPGRASLGQVIERRELPCHLIGFIERRVDCPGQAESFGHGGQRREHRERVGPADDIEIIDLSVLLAQAQALREEQEVELAALGGLGEVYERAEVDVAARRRITPHRGVVDAWEVGGQMNLFDGLGHCGS